MSYCNRGDNNHDHIFTKELGQKSDHKEKHEGRHVTLSIKLDNIENADYENKI
jgi:hypothetical protein